MYFLYKIHVFLSDWECVTRLRVLAKFCEFHSTDHEIVRQAIQTCESEKLRRSFLKVEDINIARLLELGRVHDTVENQAKLVEGKNDEKDSVDAIKHKKKSYQNTYSKKVTKSNERKCFNCGGEYPHRDECKAKGKECYNCGRLNHFQSYVDGNLIMKKIKKLKMFDQ